MPKIIDNVKENIITEAKRQLLVEGYYELTIRKVAQAVKVAVGTIYNYFPSKDILVASVMFEDWNTVLCKMDEAAKQSSSVHDGIFNICNAISSFSSIYKDVWSNYTFSASSKRTFGERHVLLRSQITTRVNILCEKFGLADKKSFTPLISEMILTVTNEGDLSFSDLSPILKILY